MTAQPHFLPRRILMTSDTLGGVWTYALDLISALQENQVEIFLATFGRPLNRDQRSAIRSHGNLHLYESSYKLEWMNDPWDDIERAKSWLLELYQETAPDLIHFNHLTNIDAGWDVPLITVVHSDVCSWWESTHGDPLPRQWLKYKEEVTRNLHAADLVVTPSHAMQSMIQELYGPMKEIKTIPNGRDTRKFKARSPDEKDPIVCVVGRLWDEAKNIFLLEQAAPKIPWRVVAIGSTESPFTRKPTLKNIETLGPLGSDETSSWLSRASIYALPAKYEPFGLSILEAALSGCALVLGDIKSLRENWDNAALFVNPNDHQECAETINFLIENSTERNRLAKLANERARFFSSKRMASMYWKEYCSLLRPILPLSQDQFIPPSLTTTNVEFKR